jgi:5'-AMP-activated protein kinase regulatory gamma subunit
MEKEISGLPVVDGEGRVLDMYTRFDAIGIAAERQFDDLSELSVEEALSPRKTSENFEGVVSCPESEPLSHVIETLISEEVHRIVVLDSQRRLSGLISLSDIIKYLVLRPFSFFEESDSESSAEDNPLPACEMSVIPEEDSNPSPWF